MSKWIKADDGIFPYQCDHCGYWASFHWCICPRCHDVMDVAKDSNVPNKKDGYCTIDAQTANKWDTDTSNPIA